MDDALLAAVKSDNVIKLDIGNDQIANLTECKSCKLIASTPKGLVNHVKNSSSCRSFYGEESVDSLVKALESANEETSAKNEEEEKVIDVHYQIDDNSSCAPVIEEGCSKLDHSKPDEIRTLTANTYLVSKLMSANLAENADAIVGMCLSNDGESIEVRTLITKEEHHLRDLGCLMNVFHAAMAVLDADLCALTLFKHSPFNLNTTGQNIVCLRNKFTSDLIEAKEKLPEPPETTCIPDRTRETHFLSENMLEAVPNQQLLNNDALAFRDMASVGVRLRRSNAPDKCELRPLFAVNMSEDWRHHMKLLGTIFTHWYGSKEGLNKVFSQLPCFVSATNRFLYETYLDCLENLRRPPVEVSCKHCSLEFRYNNYLFKEKNKFKHHEASHDLQCRICNITLGSFNAKTYHMRTHKKVSFPCSECIFVGSSQKSLESHFKYKHTNALCDFCGKNFSCGATLEIHKNAVHKAKDKKALEEAEKFFCHICGKPYCSKPVLRKHLRSHANEESIVNRHMYEDPSEYKYMCTRHDNCKKYFKKARYLKRHLQVYGDKAYPHAVHEQYVPVVSESQKFITDQDAEFWEVAEREDKARSKLLKIQKQRPPDALPALPTHTGPVYTATIPKTQTGTGAFPCHICSKSYDRKATLEKHLSSHSREDSTVNKIMKEDPTEYKYMCTRHANCKKYFKKARYLKSHLYKFAEIPYPENSSSHYMPDIRPDQKFITDQDPELWNHLAVERREEDRMRRERGKPHSDSEGAKGERPMSISSLSSDDERSFDILQKAKIIM